MNMQKTCITAHSGALQTQANTLPSIQAGLDFIGDGVIEVDVRFLPDGTPALDHDRVDENSATLEAAFALMQRCKASVNLDMKEFSHIPRVAELVDAYGLQGRAFMTGLCKARCVEWHGCGLPFYLNGTDIAAAKQLGALGLNIHHGRCNKRLVRRAREQGLLVSVWTVDRPRTMRKMLALGVDNITTRRPDILMEIINHAT